ncbi:MAG: inositol monophosphatase family protein [Chromatiales bacterium]|nr:inositol monophosphatase family protein [Chromatiales bacterium]
MIDSIESIDSGILQMLVVDAVMAVFEDGFNTGAVNEKDDGSLVTAVDTELQSRIEGLLKARWPEIPLLGEEMTLSEQRRVMSSPAFWCLDPLDGTTNFAHGIPFFATSLALIVDGQVVSGVVFDPSRRECFRADLGQGAWLNDHPLAVRSEGEALNQCVALVDLKRLPRAVITKLAERAPYRSQRSLGAVALEWCWLAAGRGQLYLHGAQRLWDYAAGLLVFKEAGGCGCIMDLDSGECLGMDRDIEAHAALGASAQSLLEQWRRWLYQV